MDACPARRLPFPNNKKTGKLKGNNFSSGGKGILAAKNSKVNKFCRDATVVNMVFSLSIGFLGFSYTAPLLLWEEIYSEFFKAGPQFNFVFFS